MTDAYGATMQQPDWPIGPNGVPRITVDARPPKPITDDAQGSPQGSPGAAPGPPAAQQSPLAPYVPPETSGGAGEGQQAAPEAGAEPGKVDQPQGSPLAPYQPPEDPKPKRDIRMTEAGARGVVNSLTFGFAPAIAGLAEASGIESTAQNPDEIDINPIRPVVGAAKLLHQWYTEHPDPKVVEAYHRGRESYREDDLSAAEQHKAAYIAGQLAGAIAIPFGTGIRGATVAARIGRTTAGGGVTGAGFEAGTETSKGSSPTEVLKSAGKGAATGAAFGAAGGTVVESIGKLAQKGASVVRGMRNSEGEAQRRITERFRADKPQLTPPTRVENQVAREAGVPRHIADFGGNSVRALAREAADTSPVAEQRLVEMAEERFWGQAGRISEWLRTKIGHADTEGGKEALKTAARAANTPLYKRAYAVGDTKFPGGMWTPEIERLMGSEALPQAAQAAAARGRNRAVAEGAGAFNPKVRFENGILTIEKGKGGVPSYPDMQFWDLVQRELRDKSSLLFRSGENEAGGAVDALRKQLVAELDKMVPEFSVARGTAAKFFGGIDALDAGKEFVTRNVNMSQAARELAKMSPAERQLFRVGFMSELADKISRSRDRVNVINQAFIDSPAARNKILMAIGPKEAREFEALLRVETQVDQLRPRLGGSMTSRNLRQLGGAAGHAGGTMTAVGVFEAAKEGEVDWKHVLFGAILIGAARKAAHSIDARTAEKVADMLLSQNPAIMRQGLTTVASDPKLFNALRLAGSSATRVGAHDIGPDAAAAGAATGLHNIINSGSAHHDGHHHGHDSVDPIAGQVAPNQ